MRLLLLVSTLGFLPACDFSEDCGDVSNTVLEVASGTYERMSGRDMGNYLAGIQHPGPVEWMEVDREAGLVRLHGMTREGPFVETYRITQATAD